MARIQVAAAGNAEKNINIIDASFQAEALRRLRGYDSGVLDNSFFLDRSPRGLERDSNADFMWKLTATNILDITVGRGMATAYGYDIKSAQAVMFTATPPATGVKYLFIYLEWDYSAPGEAAGRIEIHDNGASASWEPPRRDNLITNPTGVYQMPLYRLEVNTNGIITGRANWTELGVTTIGNPLLAENARNAEHADNASEADHAQRASNADNADRAERALYFESSEAWGTINYEFNRIDAKLDNPLKLISHNGLYTVDRNSGGTFEFTDNNNARADFIRIYNAGDNGGAVDTIVPILRDQENSIDVTITSRRQSWCTLNIKSDGKGKFTLSSDRTSGFTGASNTNINFYVDLYAIVL